MEQKICDRLKNYWLKLEPNLPFIIIVWGIGFYILRKTAKLINLENPQNINIFHLLFLGISFFFILLPFIKTIKIGKIIELERNIKETKEDVKEFKNDIRQNLQVLSTYINTSIGINQSTTINLTGNERREINKITKQTNDENSSLTEIMKDLIINDEDNMTMALARTRITMENLLRESSVLKKNDSREIKYVGYVGLKTLFQMYSKINSNFKKYETPFKYVLQICNAAMHGLYVPSDQANEAVKLGAIIIKELREQEKKQDCS
jgi:hypothetical protein